MIKLIELFLIIFLNFPSLLVLISFLYILFLSISKHINYADGYARKKGFLIENYYDYQKDGYKIILSGESIFIVAPTGKGKTELAKLALSRSLSKKKVGVYLVPTVMLLHQKAKELEEFYENEVKILIMQAEIKPRNEDLKDALGHTIIVATYEAFRSFLFEIQKRRYFNTRKPFGSVVIDESHMLGNESRGAKLETMLLKLQKEHNPQFCFLSGSFSEKSAKKWAKKFNCKLRYDSLERNFKGKIVEKFDADYKGIDPKLLRMKKDEKRDLTITECNIFFKSHIIESKMAIKPGKMLIFTYSRRAAEELCYDIYNFLWSKYFDYRKNIFCDYIHAGIDLERRKQIFNSFMSEDGIRFLFCSPVLEVGVDIKNIHAILITDGEIYNTVELTQMIGRSREEGSLIIFLIARKKIKTLKNKLIYNDELNKKYINNLTVLPRGHFFFKGFKLEDIKSQLSLEIIPILALERLFHHQIDLNKLKDHIYSTLSAIAEVDIRKEIIRKLKVYEDFLAKKQRIHNWKEKNKEDIKDFSTAELKKELKRITPLAIENRTQFHYSKLQFREYIRSSRKKIGLTYIGEATVESQINIQTADKLLHFFKTNQKPPSHKCRSLISQLVAKNATAGDPRFRDEGEDKEYIEAKRENIQEFLENFRWDIKTEKISSLKSDFYEGDIENYRKTAIWLSASLYLFYRGFLIHDYVKDIIKKPKEDYWEVDFNERLDEYKKSINRIRRLYRRYQKDPREKRNRKPGIWRHRENWRNKGPSKLDKQILKELKKSGTDGFTVKELYMKIYGDVSFRKIRGHLQNSLADKVEYIIEYGHTGRPNKRYFLKEYFNKPKYKTCNECQYLKYDPTERKKKGESKYKCNFHDNRRIFPKQRACEEFIEKVRMSFKFSSFKFIKNRPKCPGCGQINSIIIPPHGFLSICKNCWIVVFRGERGMFQARKGLQIPAYKLKEKNGFLVAKKRNYKWGIIVKRDFELEVDKDPRSGIYRFFVSKTKRRYFADAVGRITLFGGIISNEAEKVIEDHKIEVIEHSQEEIKRSEQQEKIENELRERVWKRRRKGELIEVARQMVYAKIMSNVIYTIKLGRQILKEWKRESLLEMYEEELKYKQLDRIVLTYLFYDPDIKLTWRDREEIIDILNKFRSAEGNAEIAAWESVKRVLSRKYQFIGRQSQRYAQTILYYGAKAYDKYNACLNYLYQLLQEKAGKALEKAGFNRFFPGPGILHYRIKKRERHRKYKNFYSIMTKKNKELLFDFMDSYRPTIRYYFGEFLRNDELDDSKDIWWGLDELRRRVYYVSETGKNKLKILFEEICSRKFYYKNESKTILEIMETEAQNLADYLKSEESLEYVPFCAFETREDAQWVFHIVQTIDKILGNGKIPEYMDLKPEETPKKDISIEPEIVHSTSILDPRVNICIVPHVDFDGYKSALNLTFMHSRNKSISIFPATNSYQFNYIETVLEKKVSRALKHDQRNIIYIADFPFFHSRMQFLNRLHKRFQTYGLKVEIIWFDHHPATESEEQLSLRKIFMERRGWKFYYSRKDDTQDIITRYMNQIMEKHKSFKESDRKESMDLNNWLKITREIIIFEEGYLFYRYYLYHLFKKGEKINLASFFRDLYGYKLPRKRKGLRKYLDRQKKLIKHPEKLLYYWEFGWTCDHFYFAAFIFRKDFSISKLDELIHNLGEDPNGIDMIICCWDNKTISIRASKRSGVNLHNIFNKNMGHETAIGILNPMCEYLGVDEWEDEYHYINIGHYITFDEVLVRIKISSLFDYDKQYQERFAATKLNIKAYDDDFFTTLKFQRPSKLCFPTYLKEFDKLLQPKTEIRFQAPDKIRTNTEIKIKEDLEGITFAYVYKADKRYNLDIVSDIPVGEEIRLTLNNKVELGIDLNKDDFIIIKGSEKIPKRGGYYCGSYNYMLCHKNEEQYLLDLICYLMLAAQDKNGLNSENVVCINANKFPFYQNLLNIAKKNKDFNLENIKNIKFIQVSDLEELKKAVNSLISIIKQFKTKLIIVNQPIPLIRQQLVIENEQVLITTIAKRADVATKISWALSKIAGNHNIIVLLTHVIYKEEEKETLPYQNMAKFHTELFLERDMGRYLKLHLTEEDLYRDFCNSVLRKGKSSELSLSDFCHPHILMQTNEILDDDLYKDYPELQFCMEGMNIAGIKYVLFIFNSFIAPDKVDKLRNRIEVKRGQNIDICLWYNSNFHIYNFDKRNINLKVLLKFGGEIDGDQIKFDKEKYSKFFKSFGEFFIELLNVNIEHQISDYKQFLKILEVFSLNFFQEAWFDFDSRIIKDDIINGINPINKKKIIKRITDFFESSIHMKSGLRVRWYELHIQLLNYLNLDKAQEFLNLLFNHFYKFNDWSDINIVRESIKHFLNQILFSILLNRIRAEREINLKIISNFFEDLTIREFRGLIRELLKLEKIEGYIENSIFKIDSIIGEFVYQFEEILKNKQLGPYKTHIKPQIIEPIPIKEEYVEELERLNYNHPALEYCKAGETDFGQRFLLFEFNDFIHKKEQTEFRENITEMRDLDICLWIDGNVSIYNRNPLFVNLGIIVIELLDGEIRSKDREILFIYESEYEKFGSFKDLINQITKLDLKNP